MTVPEKAEAGRDIARRKLAGECWRTICADYGISRTTARKAAREAAEMTRAQEEEPVAQLSDADLDHSLTLALTTVTEALRRCREIIAKGREDQVTIGAANAATRALSALVVAAIRTGYLDPEDECVRRRVERAERVYARLIADARLGGARADGAAGPGGAERGRDQEHPRRGDDRRAGGAARAPPRQEVRGELIRLSFHHLRIDVPLSG